MFRNAGCCKRMYYNCFRICTIFFARVQISCCTPKYQILLLSEKHQ